MKKVILLSLAMVIAVCVMAQKKKVALISKVVANRTDVSPYSTDVDKDFILPLLTTDYDVTTVLSSTTAPDLSAYDLVLYSETPGSTDAITASLKGLNKPMLVMKVHQYKPDDARNRSWGWTPANVTGGAQYYGQDPSATNVSINDPEHPIFKTPNVISNEIFSKLDLSTASTPSTIGLGWVDATALKPAYTDGKVKVLATANGSETQTAILEIVKGSTVTSTNTVGTSTPTVIPQKYIQIGIAAINYHNMTQNAKNLILNACNYLLAPATGLNAPEISDNWSVYVNGNKQIELKSASLQADAISVDIFDVKGSKLISKNLRSDSNFIIDASQLGNGAYILSARTSQGVVKKSFVITK